LACIGPESIPGLAIIKVVTNSGPLAATATTMARSTMWAATATCGVLRLVVPMPETSTSTVAMPT